MDKIEKIRQEVEELYTRIDKCIDTLIKARLNKDTNGEGKSLFQMEGLMVGTQQFLCWILDTLSEEPSKGLDVTDFCKPIDPGIAKCVADHWWEMMEEEPDKSLEEAARLYAIPHYMKDIDVNHIEEYPYDTGLEAAFIAGAEWQKEQMMDEWLKDRDGCFWDGVNEGKKAMEEQMNPSGSSEIPKDLEEAAEEIVIKMHPCLKDCTILGDRLTRGQLMALVIAGASWQKEQMLKDAVEGYVNYYEDGGGKLMAEAQVGCPYHMGDKVRIVVLKEEEE